MNSRRWQPTEYIGRNGRVIFNSIGQSASQFEVYADGPAYKPAAYPQPEPSFFFTAGKEHRRPDHFHDFLNCVSTREKPRCDEDEAFIETAMIAMSMDSFRRKAMVRWDTKKEEIV